MIVAILVILSLWASFGFAKGMYWYLEGSLFKTRATRDLKAFLIMGPGFWLVFLILFVICPALKSFNAWVSEDMTEDKHKEV